MSELSKYESDACRAVWKLIDNPDLKPDRVEKKEISKPFTKKTYYKEFVWEFKSLLQ